MTRTAGAPIGCQRPSRFWGLGCPKIFHEAEDTLDQCHYRFRPLRSHSRRTAGTLIATTTCGWYHDCGAGGVAYRDVFGSGDTYSTGWVW
ncbi:hypothetical protein, partial [Thiolapillus sp.]|uniref:hypothetical protein n=1 Tax=Thiolapillus sp. TaxID=2017437 RepID=UPI003AF6FCAF